MAGEPYDPCYHQACDDITNLSVRSLDLLSDGVAHSTFTFADDETLFTGTTRRQAADSLDDSSWEYKSPDLRK